MGNQTATLVLLLSLALVSQAGGQQQPQAASCLLPPVRPAAQEVTTMKTATIRPATAPIPPIDAAVPAVTETAVFGLG